MSPAFPVKLPSAECSKTSLMISQHWFRWWLSAIRQQAITWTIADRDLCHHMTSLSHKESNSRARVWHFENGAWTHMGCTANIIIKDIIHIFVLISKTCVFYWWDGVITSTELRKNTRYVVLMGKLCSVFGERGSNASNIICCKSLNHNHYHKIMEDITKSMIMPSQLEYLNVSGMRTWGYYPGTLSWNQVPATHLKIGHP